MTCREIGRAAHGQNGVAGRRGVAGTTGAAGQAHPPVVTVLEVADLGLELSADVLAATLDKAERYYLGDQFEAAVRALVWISRLVPATPPPQGDASAAHKRTTRDRAATLLLQLQNGLDYYGFVRNYVSPLAFPTLMQDLEPQFIVARGHEAVVDKYEHRAETAEARTLEVRNALVQVRKNRDQMQHELEEIRRQIRECEKILEVLRVELQRHETTLVHADTAFRQALEAHARCSLEDVLRCVSTVIAVGRAAMGDVTTIIGAVEAGVGAADLTNVAGIAGIIQRVQIVRSEVEDLRGRFNELQALERPETARLMLSRDDLAKHLEEMEEALKPHLGLEAARRYRDALRHHVELADTLNHRSMEYTRLILVREQYLAKLKGSQDEEAAVNADLTRALDPVTGACRNFMQHLIDDALVDIRRTLYRAHRALCYWGLEDRSLPIEDNSVHGLSQVREKLVARAQEIRVTQNGTAVPFETLWIEFNEATIPETFAALRERHSFSFSIPLDHAEFTGLAAVTVHTAFINVLEVTTNDRTLRMKLVHSGRSMFRHPDTGSLHEYVHSPRTTPLRYRLPEGPFITGAENGNLRGRDGEYIHLSPFAVWRIDITPTENPGLDLSGARSIRIMFRGTARASNG
jgi:hypothetical protein